MQCNFTLLRLFKLHIHRLIEEVRLVQVGIVPKFTLTRRERKIYSDGMSGLTICLFFGVYNFVFELKEWRASSLYW